MNLQLSELLSAMMACNSETYNGETAAQIICKHVENSVEVCEDEFLPEPNGNVLAISSADSYDFERNNVVELKTLKSTLKRRTPVAPKPILVKYRTNKEGCNGLECSVNHDDSDTTKNTSKNDASDTLNADVCVRRREGRNSRDMRSSAGASGGIFSDEFQPDFGEFHGEADEIVNGKYYQKGCFNHGVSRFRLSMSLSVTILQ